MAQRMILRAELRGDQFEKDSALARDSLVQASLSHTVANALVAEVLQMYNAHHHRLVVSKIQSDSTSLCGRPDKKVLLWRRRSSGLR